MWFVSAKGLNSKDHNFFSFVSSKFGSKLSLVGNLLQLSVIWFVEKTHKTKLSFVLF